MSELEEQGRRERCSKLSEKAEAAWAAVRASK